MSASLSPFARPLEPLARARRLYRISSLSRRTLKTGWLARAGVVYSWGIALTHALIAHFTSRNAPELTLPVLTGAVCAMSWSAGLVAWSAARNVAADEATSGLAALASMRGATPREQRDARFLATIRVVASTIGFPTAALGAFVLIDAPSSHAARALVPVVFGALGYASVFAVVLGLLSRGAAWASARHGRTLFAVLVLAPLALGDALTGFPSVVGALSWLLDRVSLLSGGG